MDMASFEYFCPLLNFEGIPTVLCVRLRYYKAHFYFYRIINDLLLHQNNLSLLVSTPKELVKISCTWSYILRYPTVLLYLVCALRSLCYTGFLNSSEVLYISAFSCPRDPTDYGLDGYVHSGEGDGMQATEQFFIQ